MGYSESEFIKLVEQYFERQSEDGIGSWAGLCLHLGLGLTQLEEYRSRGGGFERALEFATLKFQDELQRLALRERGLSTFVTFLLKQPCYGGLGASEEEEKRIEIVFSGGAEAFE